MIQRIQSVYLLLAAISMALLFIKPMSFITVGLPVGETTSNAMLSDSVLNVSDHIILLILVVLAIAIPAGVIFLYKNRKLQMKLSRANIAFIVLLIVLSIALFMQAYAMLPDGTEVTIGFGYVIPVVATIFMVLALKGISKDEKLVRSADRLR